MEEYTIHGLVGLVYMLVGVILFGSIGLLFIWLCVYYGVVSPDNQIFGGVIGVLSGSIGLIVGAIVGMLADDY